VTKNMPGAGHIIGANAIYGSKPDGLTIGTFNTGLIYNQLVGLEAIRFDLTKMSWIGKASEEARALVIGTNSPIKTFNDLRTSKVPVNISSSGVGSAGYVEIKILQEAFKLPIKIIPCYGGAEDQLAIRRGEVAGTIGNKSSNEEFVKNGFGRFIGQIGGSDKDVPQIASFAEASEAKQLIALIQSQGDLGRLTAGPPAIPARQLDALRAAYKASLEDKELRGKLVKGGFSAEPAYGEEVAKMVVAALHQTPQTVALLKEALEAKPETAKVTGPLVSVQDDGRKIVIKASDGKEMTLEPSGSRTKIMVSGKETPRNDLKAGQTCEIVLAPGSSEPSAITCP
jgi:tripartite-type tricarboxylate transporter receptor subunit TctC